MQIGFLRSPNVSDTIDRTGFLDEAVVLKPHFEALGAELVIIDWRDPNLDLSKFEFVIPKCAWDYFNFYPEFLAWLSVAEKQNVRFKNALPLIKWNSDKHYLVEMLQGGASVAPLRLISHISEVTSLSQDLQKHEKVLVKPAVSGGGKQTKVYTRHDLAQCEADAREILKDCAAVVQPFIDDVEAGEWSFFFFGGNFSHAIKKVPHKGDFRAHSLFGAENLMMSPSAAQIDEAASILEYIPVRADYARVDGIYSKGKLLLIELELIEPYLYFEYAPKTAPAMFAKALVASTNQY